MQSAANRLRMRLALYYKELDILVLFYREMILKYLDEHDVKASSVVMLIPPPQACFPGRRTFPDTAYLMSRVANMLATIDKFDVTWIASHPLVIKCAWPLSNPVQGSVLHSDGDQSLTTPPAKIAPPSSPLRRSTIPSRTSSANNQPTRNTSSREITFDIPQSDLDAMINEIL